jgi:CDP-glycerol glycerophosphotransferase (TagB/SpsB family)
MQNFHTYLAYHFVLNEFEHKIGSSLRNLWNFSGDLVTTGHTMLDEFFMHPIEKTQKSCVIYAPHFTFSHPKNECIVHYSTFLDYGAYILEYAKQHPEFNWVFKPHPVLRVALIRSGVWTEKQVDDYYAEWKSIGRIHESGDYLPLFREASTMITDCGSFLTEFAVTGQPIIHLINQDNKLEPMPLYLTYYQVCSLDDLRNQLCDILEKKNDAKRSKRLKAVSEANLCGQYAAKNIIDFLINKLSIKDNV